MSKDPQRMIGPFLTQAAHDSMPDAQKQPWKIPDRQPTITPIAYMSQAPKPARRRSTENDEKSSAPPPPRQPRLHDSPWRTPNHSLTNSAHLKNGDLFLDFTENATDRPTDPHHWPHIVPKESLDRANRPMSQQLPARPSGSLQPARATTSYGHRTDSQTRRLPTGPSGNSRRVAQVHKRERSDARARTAHFRSKQQQQDDEQWQWQWKQECWDWQLGQEPPKRADISTSTSVLQRTASLDVFSGAPAGSLRPTFSAGRLWSCSDAPKSLSRPPRPATALSGTIQGLWDSVTAHQLPGATRSLSAAASRRGNSAATSLVESAGSAQDGDTEEEGDCGATGGSFFLTGSCEQTPETAPLIASVSDSANDEQTANSVPRALRQPGRRALSAGVPRKDRKRQHMYGQHSTVGRANSAQMMRDPTDTYVPPILWPAAEQPPPQPQEELNALPEQLPDVSKLMPNHWLDQWPNAPASDSSCKPQLLKEMEAVFEERHLTEPEPMALVTQCLNVFISGVGGGFSSLFGSFDDEYQEVFRQLKQEAEESRARVGKLEREAEKEWAAEEATQPSNQPLFLQVDEATTELQQLSVEAQRERDELIIMQQSIEKLELDIRKTTHATLEVCKQVNSMEGVGESDDQPVDMEAERDRMNGMIPEMQEQRDLLLEARKSRTCQKADLLTEVIDANEMRHRSCLIKDYDRDWPKLIGDYQTSIATLKLEIDEMTQQLGNLTYRPTGHSRYERVLGVRAPATTAEMVKEVVSHCSKVRGETMEIKDLVPMELLSDSEEEENTEWVFMEFLPSLGEDKSVPKYLQLPLDAKIPNNKVPKGGCEMHIKAFWKDRELYDRTRDKLLDKKKFPKLDIYEWMYHYLVSKVGKKHTAVAELAYNLLDAALHYKHDADCDLWLKVLRGEYDESIYWDEHRMVEGLMLLLQKLDKQGNGGRITGKLHKDLLIKSLRKYFCLKTDVRFNRLKRALGKEEAAKGTFIAYIHLFKEDKDGNQGQFAEGIRDQHVEEREEYLEDIESALFTIERATEITDEQGTRIVQLVSARQCVAMLQDVDPSKPSLAITNYVKRGFKTKKQAALELDKKIESSEFLENLANGVVTTHSKRDSQRDDLVDELESPV